MRALFFISLFLLFRTASAQDTTRLLVVSTVVGDVIDSAEKAQYNILPFWKKEDFVSAQFTEEPGGKLLLTGQMKDGSVKTLVYTRQDIMNTAYVIDYRAGRIHPPPVDWVSFVAEMVFCRGGLIDAATSSSCHKH